MINIRVRKIVHRRSDRGEFFTVYWEDDTKTTVKLCEDDESDEYTAFLYALGKKLFGNKGNGRAYVKEKKQVFEKEVEAKSIEKQRQRRRQALQQSLEAENIEDISDEVYYTGFVAPCMISRAVFKKNK